MKKLTILTAVITGFLYSCIPSTYVTGSWKNTKTEGTYSHIFVAALTSNTVARATIENDLAGELNKFGIRTTESIDEIPPDMGTDSMGKDLIMERVNSRNVDAILTVTLIRKETQSRYIPGSYGYEPLTRYTYYDRFWGYYSYWYPYVYSPGYYRQDQVYFLESNLYDAHTEVLRWSAQSRTYNPSSISTFSKEFAEVIVKKLNEDGIIQTDSATFSRE